MQIKFTNKKQLLEKIKNDKNGWLLMAASDELRNDKQVVLEAIKQQWTSLQYASDNLKKDKEVVLFACKQSAKVKLFNKNNKNNGEDYNYC